MKSSYITLEALRQEISANSTRDDNLLRSLCLQSSRDFESLTRGRKFYPEREVRYFNLEQDNRKLRTRSLELLEVLELKTRGGDVIIPSTEYYLNGYLGHNYPPYSDIELYSSSTYRFERGDNDTRENVVDGYWGYHDDWGNAWVDTTDTVVNLTGNTLEVNDIDGGDLYGITPRIGTYSTLRVSDGTSHEFLFVTSVDSSLNVATVIRGYLGTQQLNVSSGAILEAYSPILTVTKAVTRLASFYYRMKDTGRGDLDRPIFTPTGIVMPSSFPKDVKEIADSYVHHGY